MADTTDTGVILQNLRNFTVQIRNASTDQIVGTGIAVSTDGKIVTCAHVVEAAGVDPRVVGSGKVGVYFPQVTGGEKKERSATVAACFANHDDDVVMLQLTDGPAPLGPEQIAVLGSADKSEGNPFRSYGYRRLDKYHAGRADGKILGTIECPYGLCVQADPVELRSPEINHGMSGAAVLDAERNLVVGVIYETWFADSSLKDRDTGWAVDGCVLGLDPLRLSLQDQPLPKKLAPRPRIEQADLDSARSASPGIVWNNAPDLLHEWAGRADMLGQITSDWGDPARRVIGLIGFGGEGKSSLARKAVDQLLAEPDAAQPDGVFWWGFYERPSVDEFFEAALRYISGGLIDPRDYPSSNAKVHLIAGMLTRGRYLFVLDGLEVLQNQDGDRYGLLRSTDMREFLGYLASSYHNSFCIITSRAPTLDLMSYTTYTHRDVDRLSTADGRELLRNLGVKGPVNALDKVVEDWDGHALTLSLLAGYLADRYGGDVSDVGEIPPPTADESRYDRVHRVLRRYEEHLSKEEQTFLTIFSSFRLPVGDNAFQTVFRADTGADALNAPLAALDDAKFAALLNRLIDYRVLRLDTSEQKYTIHPLIHAHYSDRLTNEPEPKAQALHKQIKDHYLRIAGNPPEFPTLDDLKPFIEAVHHACRAGSYDEAYEIWQYQIDQDDLDVLTNVLGAYETDLALAMGFFPNQDVQEAPLLDDPLDRGFVLNEVGLCLMGLGRLSEAAQFFVRSNQIDWDTMADLVGVSTGCQNLTELYSHLGMLSVALGNAEQAASLAQRAEDATEQEDSLTDRAWTRHLMGDLDSASTDFLEAQALEQRTDRQIDYLYGLRGIQHADHLRRTGDSAYAWNVTEANRIICEQNHWQDDLSACHRVLGDLDSEVGEHGAARTNYDGALRLARGISMRPVLIEALLARGRWLAKHMNDPSAAFSDLEEAFEYATSGGYRIYEADIRIALAWAHIAAKNLARAKAEAQRAKQMSEEMGYYWGKLDADEVLGALDAS